MKLSVIGLFALGAVAAVCAAVLVASLKQELAQKPSDDEAVAEAVPLVQVLTAAMDVSAMTVLDSDRIEVKEVEQAAAPEDCFSDPVQVVGKVVMVPMKAGQPFQASQFASEGSGLHLASALAEGKRAVSVALSDPMGMEALLYPGSTVDVLATIKTLKDNNHADETISVTLLQDIIVLAVGGQSVVAPQTQEKDSDFVIKKSDRPMVTLLVDPEQAETLKLAMHMGSVSLTMRNPMDQSRTARDGTRVTELSPILAAREKAAISQAMEERLERLRAEFDREREQAQMEIDRLKREQAKWDVAREQVEKSAPTWSTIVIRGGVPETQVFARPAFPHEQ